MAKNYTITTPKITIKTGDYTPSTWTRVITPLEGYVVSANDFSVGNLAATGITDVTFEDSSTAYALNNTVNVNYTITPVLMTDYYQHGYFQDLGDTVQYGYLEVAITGDAILHIKPMQFHVKISNSAFDTTTITAASGITLQELDISDANNTIYSISGNSKEDDFTEMFSVKFTASTIADDTYYYNIEPNFNIFTINRDMYKTATTAIERDNTQYKRVLSKTITVFARSDRDIEFWRGEMFQSVRSLQSYSLTSTELEEYELEEAVLGPVI